jgi:hypothetical protein
MTEKIDMSILSEENGFSCHTRLSEKRVQACYLPKQTWLCCLEESYFPVRLWKALFAGYFSWRLADLKTFSCVPTFNWFLQTLQTKHFLVSCPLRTNRYDILSAGLSQYAYGLFLKWLTLSYVTKFAVVYVAFSLESPCFQVKCIFLFSHF